MIYTKVCRDCGVEKPTDEFTKDARINSGVGSICKICKRRADAVYRKNNSEKLKQRQSTYYHNNREQRLTSQAKYRREHPEVLRAWREANKEYVYQYSQERYWNDPERARERSRQWAKNNPERIKQSGLRWRTQNKAKKMAQVAKRVADQLQRTPAWVDHDKIQSYYDVCKFFNEVNGYRKYHVDHIIPMRGKLVSGLHVENNMRIILATENQTKSNRFEVA